MTKLISTKRADKCRALPCRLLCVALLIVLTLVRGLVFAAAPTADLGIAASVDNPNPNVGDTIVFTLTITNYGPADVNNAQVTDLLPSNVTYVSDNSAGAYAPITGVWSVAPVKLLAGTSSSIAITVTVSSTPAAGNSFTNVASITSTNKPDPSSTNDISTVTVTVAGAVLTMVKSAQTISDPVNGASTPYNIPGATILYSLQTTNTGLGPADNNSVVITDPIPANTELYVNDLGTSGSGPVLFIDGSTSVSSGLTYSYTSLSSLTDDLEFSNDNGTTWTYIPVADANGYDAAVTNIRIKPQGSMNASDGTNNPTFILRFKVMVK